MLGGGQPEAARQQAPGDPAGGCEREPETAVVPNLVSRCQSADGGVENVRIELVLFGQGGYLDDSGPWKQ